jgi:glutamine synthetase
MGLEVESSIFSSGENPPLSERQHLFTTLGQGRVGRVLLPIWDALDEMGIRLDGVTNEFASGEIEFNLSPQPPLQAADQFVLMKLVVREMLQAAGYDITFMAMFDNERAGMTSGLHVHQVALEAAGHNIFYDPQAANGLSETVLHFLGGQLDYARHLAVLSTPTITGYRRYRPGTWAPTCPTWGLDNRTAMLRVMPHRGPSTRVENRLPDSAANPYLALAAMIVAGVEGIRQQTDPGPPATGNATTAEVSLPLTVWDAIRCLAEETAVTTFIGRELITAYRGILRLATERFAAHVTDWEIAEYRGIL